MKTNINSNLYGCSHYKRGCSFFARCCKRWYNCHLCHNEQNTHKIDITKIKRIKCSYCKKVQIPKQYCSNDNCNKCLGKYFCDKCLIYNDEYPDKSMFHCNDCNICLYGESTHYKHCNKCDYCYTDNGSHICFENKIKKDCGICLEEMYKSNQELTILKCGHAIHTNCINDYTENLIYIYKKKHVNCPICRMLIININNYNNPYYNDIIITNIYNNNESRFSNLIRFNDFTPTIITSYNSFNNLNLLSDSDSSTVDENRSNIDYIEEEINNARQEIEIRNTMNNILINNIINMSNREQL